MDVTLLYIAIALVLAFAFINGFHDGCNVIATIISSRSMNSRRALATAALAEFVGPLVLGTAVASTIASHVLRSEVLAQLPPAALHVLVIAAVGGAIVWNIVTWLIGLPSSSSHALIGGLLGAGVVILGPSAIATHDVLWDVVFPMFFSPVVGGFAGLLCFSLIRHFFAGSHSSVGHFFVSLQRPGMIFLAASHGSNDAQKSMGLIGLLLAAADPVHLPEVPWWVRLACAAAIAAGLSMGGWRIIKTVGMGIFRMQPVHSFASQLAATSVILTASLLGGPVSTTQVVASSVIGVGASRRLAAVRWTAARNIAYAWILTIPVAAALSAGLCWLLYRLLVV